MNHAKKRLSILVILHGKFKEWIVLNLFSNDLSVISDQNIITYPRNYSQVSYLTNQIS